MILKYQHRESIAQLSTLLFGLAVAYLATHGKLHHDAPSMDKPIQLRLAEIPKPEAPKPPEPPKPEVKTPPQPVMKTPQPPKPAPAPTPVASTPVAATAGPSPVQLPAAPVSPTATAIPEKPSIIANAAAEGRFAQDVRGRIEKRKVYPESALALGMTGTVEVSYVLDRAGVLQNAMVVGSSGYPLLDQAALRAVRAAAYAPMAADMWPNEKQKEFRTKVVFSID